jgi:cyclase
MKARVLFAAILFLSSIPLYAQENQPVDLTGTWRWIAHEDWFERQKGADPGQYWGIPLNDAARMRADTYDEEWISASEILQCRPRPTGHQQLGLDPLRIDRVEDPLTRQVIAYRMTWEKSPGARVVWLDGRPHPSEYGQHTWEGFSTGKFKGDALEITSTHLKESYIGRNGTPAGFRTTVIEQVSIDEPYLKWVSVIMDPDYLTEPLVRGGTYVRAPTLNVPAYPCQPEDDLAAGDKYRTPHYLPGENPYLGEVAFKYKVPIEGLRGGAETLYPEWRAIGMKLAPPADKTAPFRPVYKDDSTRIAERADAQPKVPPSYDKVEALHVAGNVYVIGGAGGNIAASIGGDGVVLVDSGAAPASEKVMATIRQVVHTWKPPEQPDSASPFADTWQATHVFPEPAIRMIFNTNDNADHVGGNANIRNSPMFRPLGGIQIVAHQAMQSRMLEAKASDRAIPTTTYFSEQYTLFRFLNNQAIQLFHMPNAISDGDSVVFFRRSDVIVAGDIYNSDIYPPIDVDKGGSIDGEIDALTKLAAMSVNEFMSQGGTMIVPGHGWISDAGDLGYYRDMMMVIRDRIQSLIDKGMTLDQVKAAKPTMDYDPLYGRQPGVTSKFVDAVYRSLKEKK